MEETPPAQRRKRPAAVYGKSARKRFSAIDDIFLSSSSTSRAGGGEGMGGRVGKPAARAANKKPTSESDDGTATQLRIEKELSQEHAREDEMKVFDFPSSDEAEDAQAAVRTLKRKRVPTTTTTITTTTAPAAAAGKTAKSKTTTTTKTTTAAAAATTAVPVKRASTTEADNMATRNKRTTRVKLEEPSTNKLTSTAKITKVARRAAPPAKKKESAMEKEEVQPERMEVEDEKVVAPPKRTRVMRTQSHQPEEKPAVTAEKPSASQDRKQRPSRNIEIVVASPRHKAAQKPKPAVEKAMTEKPTNEKMKAPKLQKSKLAKTDSLKTVPEETNTVPVTAAKKPKAARKDAVAAVKKPKAARKDATAAVKSKRDSPPTDSIFGLFTEEITPVVRRKRLIDTLGASDATEGPRKKSRSPSQDLGGPIARPKSGSTSQESSQEILVTGLQRQMNDGARVTYARQRSYRMEEPGSLEDLLNIPLPDITSMQSGRRRLEYPAPSTTIEKTSTKAPIGHPAVMSVHEMKVTGEQTMFLDDVEYLFDGLEGSLESRRTGYFELVKKLANKDFNQKFRRNSFDERLLVKMDQQTDEMILCALGYLVLGFIKNDPTPRIMFYVTKNGVMPMLTKMLGSSKDVSALAQDEKIKLSKFATEDLNDLRAMIEKSGVLGKGVNTISLQLIALQILDLLVRKFRSHGSTSEILSKGVLRGLLNILSPFATSKQYPKSLKIRGPYALELPISILEAYTMGGCGSLEMQVAADKLVVLANLLPAMRGWGCDEKLRDSLLLLLRLHINITNNVPVVCDIFAESSIICSLVAIIKEMFQALSGNLEELQRLISVDFLVLSLGLMLNFAEFSSKARAAVGDRVVESIEGTPLAIDVLLDIFLENQERIAEADSMEASHTNVAFGYLAVLLGDLSQEDHIRYRMRGRLPNSSLKCVLTAVEEFIAHHRKVDAAMFGTEDDDDEDLANAAAQNPDMEASTARLQHVAIRLRAYA